MQTQVKVQMDERDQAHRPPPNPLQPPGQQMMGQSAYAGPPQVEYPSSTLTEAHHHEATLHSLWR